MICVFIIIYIKKGFLIFLYNNINIHSFKFKYQLRKLAKEKLLLAKKLINTLINMLKIAFYASVRF